MRLPCDGVVATGGAVEVRVDLPSPLAHRIPASASTATSTPAPITTARLRIGDATRAGTDVGATGTGAAGMVAAGSVDGDTDGASAGAATATAAGVGAAISAEVAASARTNAVQLGKRFSGSLDSARSSARSTFSEIAGLTVRGSGSGACICAIITAAGVSAWYGTCPVSASNATTPNEYRSEAGPVSFPEHC